MAAYDTWNWVRKRGNYPLHDATALNVRAPVAGKTMDFGDHWTKYNTWHILYDVKTNPFNAYLCTTTGFFTINFYSWTILKALPSGAPRLCDSVKIQYESLNANMSTLATEKDNTTLEKIQLLCLLNLLLRDLIVIVNYIGDNARNTIPKLLTTLVEKISSVNNQQDSQGILHIKKLLKGETDEVLQVKNFLNHYSDKVFHSSHGKLFYRKEDMEIEEKALAVGKLGMVFNYNVNNVFALSIVGTHIKNEILKESVLMTGRWCEVFKLQYICC